MLKISAAVDAVFNVFAWYFRQHLSPHRIIDQILAFYIGIESQLWRFWIIFFRNFNAVELWKSSNFARIATRWRAQIAAGSIKLATKTYFKGMAERKSPSKLLFQVALIF